MAARRPRVFICEDTTFFRVRLSEILSSAGCELLEADRTDGRTPDLLMLPVHRVREHVEPHERSPIPILGIATLDPSGLDFDELRSLGVVGLINKRAQPEHVTYRVNQILHPTNSSSRRWPRAPIYLPVDIKSEAGVASEYAVSVSAGGMGIRAGHPIEPNTDVTLCFSGDEGPGALLEVPARVSSCAGLPGNFPTFLLGTVFYPLAGRAQAALEHIVAGAMQRVAGELF